MHRMNENRTGAMVFCVINDTYDVIPVFQPPARQLEGNSARRRGSLYGGIAGASSHNGAFLLADGVPTNFLKPVTNFLTQTAVHTSRLVDFRNIEPFGAELHVNSSMRAGRATGSAASTAALGR